MYIIDGRKELFDENITQDFKIFPVTEMSSITGTSGTLGPEQVIRGEKYVYIWLPLRLGDP